MLKLIHPPAPLVLTPSAGEPELPGMSEWKAQQRKKAEADLLRRELESLTDTRKDT